jgi:hemerythrin-like domain-containing protein
VNDDRDPFARLENTHRRIEERLATLERAASELDTVERMRALDDVYDVVRFFSRAAARHHEDEEISLFPRLARLACATELAPLLAALEAEHRAHDAVYAELSALVASFPSDVGPERSDEVRLATLARQLSEVYRAHIDREERELFPAARRALDEAACAEMASEMEARRGGGRPRGS